MERSVFIGTPTHSGNVSVHYVLGLLSTCRSLAAAGVQQEVCFLPSSVLPDARNALAREFLDSGMSHLLFADADMSFTGDMVLTLLSRARDVVGGAYLTRTGARLCYDRVPGAEPDADGLLEVVGVGTGLLMVAREAAVRMFDASPCYWRREPSGVSAAPLLFDFVFDPAEATYSGEDYAFCRRWRELGGRVYVDTSVRPGHVGEAVHTAPAPFRPLAAAVA